MPGFLGGGGSAGAGVGGEIQFPKEFIDPVTKLRVSQPENLIDTDFEYGLQPTKWETVELINNTPSFFSKSGDTTIPGIESISTNAGTREVIVVTALDHNLDVGIPINVQGTKSVTADGAYIINSIPNTKTFTYLARDVQPETSSIEDLYTAIITGEFFQGSQLRISESEGITTDGSSISELTVRTESPHGFGVNTPFYFLNLNSTISQEFAAANTETKSFDSSNSATAQTFDGSNTLSSINIDFSNSANVGAIPSTVDRSIIGDDSIVITHGVQNFVGLEVGQPLYYDVTSPGGYFLTNPRGVVFLAAESVLGESSSTIKVSEVPNGPLIPIETNISGEFKIANQARTFAGNNVNQQSQNIVTIVNDEPKPFNASNSNTTVITVSQYSGGGLVTGDASVGATDVPWYQGTMVRYDTTGAAASGLVNGATYFVDTTFQQGTSNTFSFSLKDFPGGDGNAISSISGGSGTQTFTQIDISLDKDVIHIRNHGYAERDMLRYDYPEGGRFSVESVDQRVNFYFVQTVYDENNFTLTQTLGELVPNEIFRTGTEALSDFTPTEVTPIGLEPPITYAVTSGALPDGLTLNTSTGVVSGRATQETAFREVVITATDSLDSQASQTHFYQFDAPSVVPGQAQFTSPGTYSWTAPYSTNVSVVAIGGGGSGSSGNSGSAGGGAGLGWKNDIPVVQGNTYTVVVGSGASGRTSRGGGGRGGDSYFINTSTVRGGGGGAGPVSNSGTRSTAAGGTFTGDGGGNGGRSGYDQGNLGGCGGGGAGGYSGTGGRGGQGANTSGQSGSGGAAGGGTGSRNSNWNGSWGGGTGIFGEGSNGAGASSASRPVGGGGGSGGEQGRISTSGSNRDLTGSGARFGGGGAGPNQNRRSGDGGHGAVRIIWPSETRRFPSTGTENV